MEFLSKESINSKELLKQINYFREIEYKEKEANNTLTEAQKKRSKFVKLGHDTLLKIIKKEFNLKIDLENIFEMLKEQKKNFSMFTDGIFISTYKDKYDRDQIMFILTIDQAKQVLMRESKVVRKAVIQYLNLLEKRIRELERKKGKITRKQETDSIKMLMEYGNIPKEKQHLYYMTYSKLPFIVLGMKKVSRDTLPADDLNLIKELESIIQVTILTSIIKGLEIKAIYKECKKVCNEALENTEQKLIS